MERLPISTNRQNRNRKMDLKLIRERFHVKTILLLWLVVLASTSFASERSETPRIYESLAGDGLLITVPYGEKNEFLVYFEGFENIPDPVAKLYRKENAGNGTEDHYYRLVGTETIDIQNRSGSVLVHGSLIPYIEVIDGAGEKTKMVFREKGGAFETDKVIARYQKYQNPSPSHVEAKKSIAAGQARMQQACGGIVSVNVDWNAFEAKENRSVPGMLQGHLDALRRLCEADEDYRMAAATINEIHLIKGGAPKSHNVTMSNRILTISLHPEAVNVPDTAYAKIQKAL